MTDNNTNFKLNLPDSWENNTVYTYMGPDDSGLQHILNLTIDTYVETDDLSEYAKERINIVLENIHSAEVLLEEERTLDNGHQAYVCVYKWSPSAEQIIYQKLVYMIINNIGYNFIANFTKKTFKTIGIEVDRIINSLTPVDTE